MRVSVPFAGVPARTWLLCLGQAVNLTAAVMMVTVSALAGARLAPTAAWATLPYGVQFAALMVCTYPAAALMRRWGRRPVFQGSALLLIAAGGLGMLALQGGHFAWLVGAHGLVGAYAACANFFRFAAVDGLADPTRARALSLVVAGGVLAAVAGPTLATALRQAAGFAEFAGVYGALIGLGFMQLGVLAAWRPTQAAAAPPGPPAASASPGSAPQPSPGKPDLPRLQLAMALGAGSYLAMNLLMIQASLLLRDLCSFSQSSQAIQMHVLAMFLPSLLTGPLIARMGLRRVLAAGCILLAASTGLGLAGPSYLTVSAGLLLLGLGWNLCYVGGSALLTQSAPPAGHHRWQGLHETVTAACATAGAFLPAPLLASWGSQGTGAAVLAACLAGWVACLRLMPARRAAQGLRHA